MKTLAKVSRSGNRALATVSSGLKRMPKRLKKAGAALGALQRFTAAVKRDEHRELFAGGALRNDDSYRTSSFIAPSRPSMVIGNMRCENSRRMMVVDSE